MCPSIASPLNLIPLAGLESSAKRAANQPFLFIHSCITRKAEHLCPSTDSSPAANFKLLSQLLFLQSNTTTLLPCLHPCHIPVTIGIQRVTDGSFMHPTYFQRAADGLSHLHPKERLTGPLVHSKSHSSDRCHLPSIASWRSSPPAS